MKADTAVTADSRMDMATLFGPGGPLDRALEDFAPRPEQLAMAEAVMQSLTTGEDLVIEAGTGTGKTLAYLLPLLVAGQRAVISTATRTLQDQLYHRDLPALSVAMGRPVKVRLLKGRGNYLCLYRLGHAQAQRNETQLLREIQAWALQTRTGDIAELADVPEASPLWQQATSTADNCLGSKCPRWSDCHVVKARQAARDADVVVVNHHLLMADLTIKEEGFGELLPGIEVAVVDEAHRFPDIAQRAFNQVLSAAQVRQLLDDIAKEAAAAGMASAALAEQLRCSATALASARECLPSKSDSMPWPDTHDRFVDALDELDEALQTLVELLDQAHSESPGVVRCLERARRQVSLLQALVGGDNGDSLRWIRPAQRGFTINMTPVDASGQLATLLAASRCTWIYTSATLSVDGEFEHFSRRLGSERINSREIASPFDFATMSRLYLPAGMPSPADAGFIDCLLEKVRPVLAASGGRAFLLFTSHRALQRAAAELSADPQFSWPLLVQGQAPRSQLLERFAQADGAVLLGTATFWEGVDIRGSALVLVVIDKLPFASPSDPLLAARLTAIREEGGDPFRDQQLPYAVLALKQGVGRLIRGHDDYGVVMLCDPRLQQRGYGRVFLNSLPPMPIVSELAEVEAFFAERGHV